MRLFPEGVPPGVALFQSSVPAKLEAVKVKEPEHMLDGWLRVGASD
jgi:hypothetical protein